jgi:hypothetical protein
MLVQMNNNMLVQIKTMRGGKKEDLFIKPSSVAFAVPREYEQDTNYDENKRTQFFVKYLGVNIGLMSGKEIFHRGEFQDINQCNLWIKKNFATKS